jgi:hypothetical protein
MKTISKFIRRATLTEAKSIRPEGTVVMPHSSDDAVFASPDGGDGMFLAVQNKADGRDAQRVAADMVSAAAEMGMECEILSITSSWNGGWKIQFILGETKASRERAVETGTFNTQPIKVNDWNVTRHVPNMNLRHEAYWVETLLAFGKRKGFADANKLHLTYKGSAQRLYKEGMLERHHSNFNLYRLTAAGEAWLKQAPVVQKSLL